MSNILKHIKHSKKCFQVLPKEFHQLKYEAIRVPQGSVRLDKKKKERKSSTCYLMITKGVTTLSINANSVSMQCRACSFTLLTVQLLYQE
ncbi:UNVERIFIED_CONTAM: hypothetical protein NCL1_50044 [Trichonephila clavipes]